MVDADIDDVSVDTKQSSSSLILPLAVLVRLDRVLHMTHRFEEFRVTGRIELQASVGQAGR